MEDPSSIFDDILSYSSDADIVVPDDEYNQLSASKGAYVDVLLPALPQGSLFLSMLPVEIRRLIYEVFWAGIVLQPRIGDYVNRKTLALLFLCRAEYRGIKAALWRKATLAFHCPVRVAAFMISPNWPLEAIRSVSITIDSAEEWPILLLSRLLRSLPRLKRLRIDTSAYAFGNNGRINVANTIAAEEGRGKQSKSTSLIGTMLTTEGWRDNQPTIIGDLLHPEAFQGLQYDFLQNGKPAHAWNPKPKVSIRSSRVFIPARNERPEQGTPWVYGWPERMLAVFDSDTWRISVTAGSQKFSWLQDDYASFVKKTRDEGLVTDDLRHKEHKFWATAVQLFRHIPVNPKAFLFLYREMNRDMVEGPGPEGLLDAMARILMHRYHSCHHICPRDSWWESRSDTSPGVYGQRGYRAEVLGWSEKQRLVMANMHEQRAGTWGWLASKFCPEVFAPSWLFSESEDASDTDADEDMVMTGVT